MSNHSPAAGRSLLYLVVAGAAWGTAGAAASLLFLASDLGPLALSFWRCAGGLVVLLGWVVLVATVFAYVTGVVSVRRLSPQVAGVVAFLEAVVATVLAWILLGEYLSTWQIVGGALVLGGAFIAQSSRPAPQPTAEPVPVDREPTKAPL